MIIHTYVLRHRNRTKSMASSTLAGSATNLAADGKPDAPVLRPPLPPFTEETARLKVQMAEDAWNSKDPARCAAAYTEDFVRARQPADLWPLQVRPICPAWTPSPT